jgi:hypothetical protein
MESLLHEMVDPFNLIPTVVEVNVDSMAKDARLPSFLLKFFLGHVEMFGHKHKWA